jgi:hypothetical protein
LFNSFAWKRKKNLLSYLKHRTKEKSIILFISHATLTRNLAIWVSTHDCLCMRIFKCVFHIGIHSTHTHTHTHTHIYTELPVFLGCKRPWKQPWSFSASQMMGVEWVTKFWTKHHHRAMVKSAWKSVCKREREIWR